MSSPNNKRESLEFFFNCDASRCRVSRDMVLFRLKTFSKPGSVILEYSSLIIKLIF